MKAVEELSDFMHLTTHLPYGLDAETEKTENASKTSYGKSSGLFLVKYSERQLLPYLDE